MFKHVLNIYKHAIFQQQKSPLSRICLLTPTPEKNLHESILPKYQCWHTEYFSDDLYMRTLPPNTYRKAWNRKFIAKIAGSFLQSNALKCTRRMGHRGFFIKRELCFRGTLQLSQQEVCSREHVKCQRNRNKI